jgi:hypothetical protein
LIFGLYASNGYFYLLLVGTAQAWRYGHQEIRNMRNIYTFDVYIISGPMSEEFVEENPVILRKIEIQGDQTLEDLHLAIFDAFDREEEHVYEYQIGGKGPNDPKAVRFTTPDPFEISGELTKPFNNASSTTIDSLKLNIDDVFGYWFDFGDDWWHQINVASINSRPSTGKYPKVIERIGDSPPQYQEIN